MNGYRYYCLECEWTSETTLIDFKPAKCPNCKSVYVVATMPL